MELSPEKTKVTHTTEGFDFLGQNVRRYMLRNGNSKFLIKPSEKNIKTFLTKVRQTIIKMRTAKQENVIGKLAPMIIGWANYHRHVVSKEVYHKVDYKIWLALWRWAKRRHPNKGRKWISQRYFHQVKGVKRAFSCTTVDEFGNIRRVTLPTASATRIVRHPQIHPAANPFDPEWDAYFEKRQSYKMHHNSEGRAMIESLRKHQKGVCPQCGKPLPVKSQREYIHHLIGRLEGGKPTFDNLILLHEKCHAEGHKNGWKNMLPVEPHQVST